MENIKILEKNFKGLMSNKDFKSFNRTHPTLMNVIMKSMNEVRSKNTLLDLEKRNESILEELRLNDPSLHLQMKHYLAKKVKMVNNKVLGIEPYVL